MFNRDDFEQTLERARMLADIVRALAQCDVERPSLYLFLGEELDAKFELLQAEIEALPAPPMPPPMPPLTERERAGNAEITEKLRELGNRLRQRNLDRAVELAREAAEGRGPLMEHFGELGRRFAAEVGEEEPT